MKVCSGNSVMKVMSLKLAPWPWVSPFSIWSDQPGGSRDSFLSTSLESLWSLVLRQNLCPSCGRREAAVACLDKSFKAPSVVLIELLSKLAVVSKAAAANSPTVLISRVGVCDCDVLYSKFPSILVLILSHSCCVSRLSNQTDLHNIHTKYTHTY